MAIILYNLKQETIMPPKNSPLPSMSDFILSIGGQPIGSIVQCVKSPIIFEDEPAEPEPPKIIRPTASFSFQTEMSKDFKQVLKDEFRTRPDRCTKRHYKWRLRKKWFNRYEKKRWIGSEMLVEGSWGETLKCCVSSVKLTKNGLEVTSKSVCHADN